MKGHLNALKGWQGLLAALVAAGVASLGLFVGKGGDSPRLPGAEPTPSFSLAAPILAIVSFTELDSPGAAPPPASAASSSKKTVHVVGSVEGLPPAWDIFVLGGL